MALIPLSLAKQHLRITTDAGDADIYAKTQQAEAIVLNRCNGTAESRAVTAAWTASTLPLDVQAAMLLVLTSLYEDRGEDMVREASVRAAVDRLVITYKGLV